MSTRMWMPEFAVVAKDRHGRILDAIAVRTAKVGFKLFRTACRCGSPFPGRTGAGRCRKEKKVRHVTFAKEFVRDPAPGERYVERIKHRVLGTCRR